MAARAARLTGRLRLGLLALLLVLVTAWALLDRDRVRSQLVTLFAPEYERPQLLGPLAPRFAGTDAGRKQIALSMKTVAKGLEQPTDIQFPPDAKGYAVVLAKAGTAHWLRLANGAHGVLFRVEVLNQVEEGLLGLAFHPQFAQNRRFFINYVAGVGGKEVSRVAEWRLTRAEDFARSKAEPVRVLMELEQPYPNHNGGGLAFGPDGYLYIGWGDGGFRDDPHGHGQNPMTWLGSMLRIDVDAKSEGLAYAIPADNPFVGKPNFRPETWAYGLRNPWRYSFDARGRLIVADVGQNRWEEIDIVRAGDNLGWAIKEGFACFGEQQHPCQRKDLVDPVFVYGRDQGASVTGGYEYTGKQIAELSGLYVFGDFISGRLFALPLPEDRGQRIADPIALGQWPMMPSAFGRDLDGELYVADFTRGEIHRLAPAAPRP
jgi:glucose/arabinose dehydrogenase